MAGRRGLLTLDALREQVAAGTIDTVLVAITDMQGRLQGKRCSAEYFLEEVVGHATEACNYLLAVDVDMNTVDGYAISSWDAGYGDFVLRPDFTTLRLVPWQEGTALVLADVERVDGGGPVAVSPRQVLRRQLDRLADKKLQAFVGTELEFIVFDDSYETAWDKRYQGIKPSNQYNVDYSMLGTARVEPLLRRIRNEMAGAGLYPESAKGECNPGQQEIAFRYAEALTTCDNHSVYKNGAKEIAAQEGKSLTFMAKYNEREGNSCHIHLSLRGTDGSAVLPGDGDHGFSKLMEHFLAGQLAALRELTYFFAPNINSYKRFVRGSFAPTAVAWGTDNRTCALRVVGHGDSLRVENRVPGGDVNPYLAVAALIAAGLHGIENELPLEPEFTGNAYGSDKPTVPTTLGEAADVLAGSRIAREAFGDDVVDHYLNAARVEREAFEKAVTDWELIRGFERL
ncbi:glutamine synthetase family protein [Amycolatopsis sp. NPDC051372]|uniref:glutamine synthetase family protein n=1 Tax=Amycolatopsis sp. NPDC051372 TaxID=3155669 RepID=UPI0034434E1F